MSSKKTKLKFNRFKQKFNKKNKINLTKAANKSKRKSLAKVMAKKGKQSLANKKTADKIRRQESKTRLKAAEEAEKRKEEREDEEKARKKMIKNRKFNRSKGGQAYNAIKRRATMGGKGLGKGAAYVGKGGLNLGKKGFAAAGKAASKLKESRSSRSRLKNSACWKETKRIAALDPRKLAQFNPGELGRLESIYDTSKCGKTMSIAERAAGLLSGATHKRKLYKKYLKKVVEKNVKRQNKNEEAANDTIVRKNTGGYQNGKDLFLKF